MIRLSFRHWLNRTPRNTQRNRRRSVASSRRHSRLTLETLEQRWVPSTVTNLADSGPGSLRDAIATTPAGGTVDFQPGLTGTIVLTTGELAINNDLTITGPGANVITVSGNHAFRVFEITGSFTVAISGLTIRDGFAPSQPVGVSLGFGGGILNDSGTLSVLNCTIAANNAGEGGGIANLGTEVPGARTWNAPQMLRKPCGFFIGAEGSSKEAKRPQFPGQNGVLRWEGKAVGRLRGFGFFRRR